MRLHLRPSRAIAFIVLLSLVSMGAMCNESSQRKLLKAQDDAAVLISKGEKVTSDLLLAQKIEQPTANAIYRYLLKANTAVKHIAAEGDRYAANPTIGSSATRAAIQELRNALEEAKTAVQDGSIGIGNAEIQQSIISILTSLQGIAGVAENVVIEIERGKK